MKNCPYCKAELDSDAKFCVYCMRSLEKKEAIGPAASKKLPRYLWLIGFGLALIAAVLIIVISSAKKVTPHGTNGAGAATQMQSDDSKDSAPSIDHSGTTEGSPYIPNSSAETTAPGGHNPSPSNPSSTTVPTGPNPTTSPTSSNPTTQPTVPPTTLPPATTTPTTTLPPSESSSIYNYRLVASGEEYNAGYVNSGNDIIITGVKTPNGSGIYDVPAYIDGMRVLVIAPNAFSGSGARQVYLPSTVKTIWGNAFSGCPLTDIYFRGSSIYAAGNAFSGITGSLTIHCSANCSDRNYRYYKNTAPDYGAVFAEWNG